MTEPTGGSSLPSSPGLVTNSDDPLLPIPIQDTTLLSSPDLTSTSERRQLPDSESLVTEIVQTVSLVHYVSRDGTPISIKTFYSEPTTALVDPATGQRFNPVTGEDLNSLTPTPPTSEEDASSKPQGNGAVGASDLDLPESPEPELPGSDIIPSIPDLLPVPTQTDPISSVIPSQDVPISSLASDIDTVFPTLAPSLISSAGLGGFRNLTFPKNNTSIRVKTASPSSLWSTESATSTSASTKIKTKTPNIITETGAPAPGGGFGGSPVNDANVEGDDAPTSTPTGTVVGSVVGSIAGAALIVFVIMALLRWRKRQSGRQRLSDNPTSNDRGLFLDGGPDGGVDGGSGGNQGMAQRSLPFAVPAVLASFASIKSQSSAGNSKSAETGFYRVSGKKLPSVLQYGGDGFSDPRGSMISGSSSQYPESHTEGGLEVPQRYALGNPMRPVSGVPIFRSSPARTPVTEENPFADPLVDPPSPPRSLRPDAVGRSLTAQDVSRVSSSRFVEDV